MDSADDLDAIRVLSARQIDPQEELLSGLDQTLAGQHQADRVAG